ncbi:hypothetical protein GGS23DRAFT_561701 [Durotheca rogersii]|uniref:uncharacterized protein n=1 Tax=Durotheca rogersii TaxID=419775 RepID=UPI00221F1278|nr:uncharacterized protein GGS23DRAFT_561701 [Durotheca rogersii]KAI5864766.1 hypothetical protein GGS23DRAFT_561701 [Durotheca rogersii]
MEGNDAEKAEAKAFIRSLINKNLRVYTTDGRLFVGTFKCTDTHGNVVLSLTYEYRQPSAQKLAEAAAASTSFGGGGEGGAVKADMTSRYLGLVVVPSEHVVKMEVEEFVSQVKNRLRTGEGC